MCHILNIFYKGIIFCTLYSINIAGLGNEFHSYVFSNIQCTIQFKCTGSGSAYIFSINN
jgi:hypothetical protein